MPMTRRIAVAAVVVLASVLAWAPAPAARAQEASPEDLRKMYEDALVQLRAAQDRRSELAAENEQLATRVAELEAQLAEARTELADVAEHTFFHRAHYAAWRQFIDRHPELKARWDLFLENGLLSTPSSIPDTIIDRDWPLSSARG